MTVKSGGSWAGTFVTLDATGALATPSTGPAGVLYVDGASNAATVTITGSNPYKWSVTLPTLTAGQRVDMYITATISTIATAGIVASEQADTSLLSDGVAVASIATDAIDADALKADAVTEIQSGLALEATLTAMKGAGWTDETLVAILTAVEAVSAGSGASAAEVWAYAARTLTQSAAAVASAVAGSTITATRGDTLSAALTDIGALTNYSKIWFTVKADDADTDAESLVQIELSDGLKYINGAAATTASNGSITINDEATGKVTILLEAPETAKLSPGSYHYDIQILRSTGIAVSTLSSGTFIVSADYTRAVA